MSASFKRAVIALVAWPVGVLAALFWMIGSMMDGDGCVDTPAETVTVRSCNVPMTSLQGGMILVLAVGPGIFATRVWWKGRRDDDDRE